MSTEEFLPLLTDTPREAVVITDADREDLTAMALERAKLIPTFS